VTTRRLAIFHSVFEPDGYQRVERVEK
jgi:hypothetical protein